MPTKTKQALTLDVVTKLVTEIVSSAVNHMEERITRKLSRDIVTEAWGIIEDGVHLEKKQVHMHQSTPLVVAMSQATPMKPVLFNQLPPGSVFRLYQGSQPIMKLEKAHGWGAEMYNGANAFYLRTGSTNRIPETKEVIPLKATITIDG